MSIVTSLVKSYNGKNIRINPETKYVCITDMAFASGKQSSDWTRLKKTDELKLALATKVNIPLRELVVIQVDEHGTSSTWAHPKLSIQFAQWCSPMFALQVSDWMDELMTKGSVSIAPKSALQLAKEQVKLLEELELAQEQIKLLVEATERQAEVIDELFNYSSIVRVAKFNQVNEGQFEWSRLKSASKLLNIEIKKAPCPRYGTKNLYGHDAWRYAYPLFRLPETLTVTLRV